MALSYYDDAIIAKLKKWMPDDNRIRVLGPDETKRFFETRADDTNDAPVQLPMITLSRNKDIEILSTIKQLKSFNGLFIMAPNDRNLAIPEKSVVLNVIPVKTTYQLDIYAKTRYEAEEYVRNFLFKIINNPQIIVQVPYNNIDYKHTANLRVLETVSDTSDIAQRVFPGQFYKWTIQMELQDGFLFNLPYKPNAVIGGIEISVPAESALDGLEEIEMPEKN
jgi:hypothetical protein